MLYEFKGHRPVVDPTAFVHPQAAVTGNVIISKQVYIGPGAAIRGDWGQIVIEDGCNVQENCTIHMFPGITVRLMEGAHIGHGAIVHGATIGRNCLIGMNAVIMDGVVMGDECIVGALSFVKAKMDIPARSMLVGNPAKIIKQVSDEMLEWKSNGTAIYQRLPQEMKENWSGINPLSPLDAPINSGARPENADYRPWKEHQASSGEADAGKEPYPTTQEPSTAYGYEKRRFAIEEYLQMEEFSNVKHEFYQGEIFAMAGAKPDHNTIVINIIVALGIKLRDSSCRLFNSDQRVHIAANTLFTYPDVSLVCGEPVFLKNDDCNLTNPAMIIEVLSPSTMGYDRVEKFHLYKHLLSLQEYMLVDAQAVFVEHFVKDAAGKWILRKYERLDECLLVGSAGVSLSLAEIYEKARFLKR